MKIKYPKRTTEDDLRDLVIESKELTEQIRQLYNNYMIAKFGEQPIQHLPCDACEEGE